jgi:hypothetical protein
VSPLAFQHGRRRYSGSRTKDFLDASAQPQA